MRFDHDFLGQRRKNIIMDSVERVPPPRLYTKRQREEMEAISGILCGDPYNWITPSMFDPEAQRLRDKYPAAGTTRIKWLMDDETTLRVTGDMRTSDFEVGYTKNDHLAYAYGGGGYRKRGPDRTYGGKMGDMLKQLPTPEEVERQAQVWRDAYPHARIIGDEIDLTPVTLSPEGEAAPLELPQWAEGLPPMTGFRGERYHKGGDVPAVFDGKVVRYHADAAKIGKGLLWGRPRALAYGIDRGMPVEEFGSDDSITRVWTPGDLIPDEARPYMDPHITLKQFADRFFPAPPEDTLAEEIKADAERAAELAAKTPPGFIQYEEAKKQGLVDEDPWPTTEEILAAHAAKHYADGLREDAERDLARIEARNAFKVALRKSAITASLIMIGGVAACFAVGLIGALVYTAFNFFLPRMQGSETAATVGGYTVLILFGLLFGALVGTSTRR